MPIITSSQHRRTGVYANVIDDNLNSWEDFAGTDINVDLAYRYIVGDGPEEWEQGHWSYRGQSAMCKLANGNVVRVTIGDGSESDRTIYRQIITDPTDPTEWATWTQLYTGDHYAVAIEADATAGAGYRVYHAKAAGLYMDNVLKITKAGIVRIKPMHSYTGYIYYQVVEQDTDTERKLTWWLTNDIRAGTPGVAEDCASYRWYRHDMVALRSNLAGDQFYIYRFRSMALDGGARHKGASEQLTIERVGPFGDASTPLVSANHWQNIRHLKGPSAQAGFKTITNLYVTSLSSSDWSSAYYLFYNERQRDIAGNVMSNLKMPLFWSRSVGFPYYLSQPVPVGYSIWGFAGAVEVDDHIYIAGNGRVLRRPNRATEVDITNHIIEGGYSIPRDNQNGSGKLVCANKDNVLGEQLGITDATDAGLTERRVMLGLGLKGTGDTDYQWKRDNAWWVSRFRKSQDNDEKQHLEIELGDFWHRMDASFRDTYNILGQFKWKDWSPAGVNQLYNWSNDTDEFFRYNPAGADPDTVPRLRTIPSGTGPLDSTITLFAGWRGENGYVYALFHAIGRIVFRYQDPENFLFVGIGASTTYVGQVLDGDETILHSIARTPGASYVEVDFRFGRIKVDVNFVNVINYVFTSPPILTGFVGFMSAGTTADIHVSNVRIEEWHDTLTTRDLLRTLLAYIEEHQVKLEEAAITDDPEAEGAVVAEDPTEEAFPEIEQSNLLWGPQSDLDTPAKAMRQILEASKLSIIWREDESDA